MKFDWVLTRCDIQLKWVNYKPLIQVPLDCIHLFPVSIGSLTRHLQATHITEYSILKPPQSFGIKLITNSIQLWQYNNYTNYDKRFITQRTTLTNSLTVDKATCFLNFVSYKSQIIFFPFLYVVVFLSPVGHLWVFNRAIFKAILK